LFSNLAARNFPAGIVLSALAGGAGKTLLSLGIARELRHTGYAVAAFKKGPDYIDAGWLALAADRDCYNLDTFMLPADKVVQSFYSRTRVDEIAVVEGNRGLYDGIDTGGQTSTAELAKLLGLPVVLCLDCRRVTRTMAAVVSGCLELDPAVHIGGIILNRVAGPRHERVLRESLADCCDVPIIGAVPQLEAEYFPERHMGLVPTPEHGGTEKALRAAARLARDYLDLDALVAIAAEAAAPPALGPTTGPLYPRAVAAGEIRVGIFRDSAFQFYYPENIEALEAAGAGLTFLSPLKDSDLAQVDALYIGGGFPETHAAALAANRTFLEAVAAAARNGMPIYAECGGLMYLSEALLLGNTYPMAGIVPAVFGLASRPQALGYTRLTVSSQNPYFPIGTEIRGHEFHYSRLVRWSGRPEQLVFSVGRGKGITADRDGFSFRNVLAGYTHLHALGQPGWAPALTANARRYRAAKEARNHSEPPEGQI